MIEMTTERAGRLVTVGSGPDGFAAFVPAPLPPDPPLRVDGRLQSLLDEAAPGAPLDDVEETATHIVAMSHGVYRIASGELP